ncbi:3-oxoacyl-ACP reductase FabG [Alicyclobacillus sp. ALC3]|nr:3-oxoacyl-ACP reductase FabG [Alicyclobacillus sp. ALC3]
MRSQFNSPTRPLGGQVAIVTGASGGIGQAIARELAAGGADIVVHYHSGQGEAVQVAEDCRRFGVRVQTVQADLAVPEQAAGIITAATALGSPQILVNNAGVSHTALYVETSLEAFEHVLRVNLVAPHLCMQSVLPHMLRQGYGRIVNVASVWGMVGGANEAAYSASKGGLIALSKALAKELGPSGVTVNVVAPGAIETQMLHDLTEADRAELRDRVPVGRIGSPTDVAAAVAYLVSPAASYVTGQVLSPNGGWQT